LSSIVKIAWEREEDLLRAVSLDWRAWMPRLRIQYASYKKKR